MADSCTSLPGRQRAGIIVGFIVLWLGMFSYVMNGSLGRDENMYVAASILTNSQSLYADFAYLQMPYFPLVCGAAFKITGTSHYLLWGRLLSFGCMVAASILVYLIAWRLSGNRLVAACMVALLAFNSVLIRTSGYCWNSVLPIPLALGAFYLFVLGVSDRVRPLPIFLTGVLVSLAIGTRLLYVAVAPAFLLATLFFPRSLAFTQRVGKSVIPLIAGMVAGMLPASIYLMRDFDRFMFENVGYHRLNTDWYALQGATDTMTLGSKLDYARCLLVEPSNLMLVIAVIALGIAVIKTFLSPIFSTARREPRPPTEETTCALGCGRANLPVSRVNEEQQSTKLTNKAHDKVEDDSSVLPLPSGERAGVRVMPILLSALLVLFTTAIVFATTPFQNQYFALPIPFAILLVVCLYAAMPAGMKRYAGILLVCAVIVSAYFTGPRLFRYKSRILAPSTWTPMTVHKTAERIRDEVKPLADDNVLATLSPLYAVEAGLRFLPEFATGPFMFRVGGLIPAEKRRAYIGVSISDIESLFDKATPKAIFVGFEEDLDAPFVAYALEHGYVRIEKDFQGGTLYVRGERSGVME